MGQKTNSNLFRLVINNKYLSTWYSKKNEYAKLLQEDNNFKKQIVNNFQEYFTISKLELERKESTIKKIITFKLSLLCPKETDFYSKAYTFFSTQKYKASKRIAAIFDLNDESLLDFSILMKQMAKFLKRKTLQQLSKLNKENIYFLKITFLQNPYLDCALIAKLIGEQIQKRVSYRKVIKQTIDNLKLSGIKGAIIVISGRLNGVEMARTEITRYGRVPLHTLKANIDYYQYNVETIYGIIGLKIWINKD